MSTCATSDERRTRAVDDRSHGPRAKNWSGCLRGACQRERAQTVLGHDAVACAAVQQATDGEVDGAAQVLVAFPKHDGAVVKRGGNVALHDLDLQAWRL